MVPFEYKELYKYPNTFILNVTNNCNLQCRYCFVNQSINNMSLEIGKKTLDFIDQLFNKKRKLFDLPLQSKYFIVFFGGEPLLLYDSLIKPLVLYCKEKQYQALFSITTNGILLNKEKLDFFKEHQISLLLSFDGNKKTQDFNRPCKNGNSSFDILKEKIPLILEYYPFINCRGTLYLDSLDNFYNDYIYIESLGFKNFTPGIDVTSRQWDEDDLNHYENQIRLIYEYRKDKKNNMNFSLFGTFINQIRLIPEENYRGTPNKKIIKYPCLRCGLGTGSISVNSEGELYSCHHLQFGNELFNIGNIENGIDEDKHIKLLQAFYTSIEKEITNDNNTCSKDQCDLYKICKKMYDGTIFCIVQNYLDFNDFNTINHVVCKIMNINYKYAKMEYEYKKNKENSE